MPVQHQQNKHRSNQYYHLFNKGLENKLIFREEEDYVIFTNYLEEYLSTQVPEQNKKTFTVQGRTFKGIPHQPKNYFNKAELIAFSMSPNRFHLLLHQKSDRVVEKLLRSLCTRYSMYFNKKYNRSGPVFDGPYKSFPIADLTQLMYLTRYIHLIPKADGNGSSSYSQYIGTKEKSWVKPEVPLTRFESIKPSLHQKIASYKDFVEKYELDSQESALLKGVTPLYKLETYKEQIPKRAVQTDSVHPDSVADTESKKFGFLFLTVMFVLLLGLGVRSVTTSSAKVAPSVPLFTDTLGIQNAFEAEVQTPTPEPETKEDDLEIMLIVIITNEEKSANIYLKPSEESEVIYEAIDGETLKFISKTQDWYEVSLENGLGGFISAKYIEGEIR